MKKTEFYKDGLSFECNGCSKCCCIPGGVVLLSPKDLVNLCLFFGIRKDEFIQKYCTFLQSADDNKYYLCLKDKNLEGHEGECIFWDKKIPGCQVYKNRPVQCRTYPFWTTVMKNKETWDNEVKDCPGINRGGKISAEEIELQLKEYQENKIQIIKNAIEM